MMSYHPIENLKLTLCVALALAFSITSCHKEPEIIVEEPQLTLDQCGPLQYRHSMFIINNECWGVNEHPYFQTNRNKISLALRRDIGEYTETLIISQQSEEKPNPKTWKIIFDYGNGSDGTYAMYSKSIIIDSSSQFKININEETNIIEGTISNFTMVKPAYEGGRFPTKIVISEGSFRTSVKK